MNLEEVQLGFISQSVTDCSSMMCFGMVQQALVESYMLESVTQNTALPLLMQADRTACELTSQLEP